MKRIWRMAGVGLLVVTVGTQVMADERAKRAVTKRGPGRGPQGRSMNGAPKEPAAAGA